MQDTVALIEGLNTYLADIIALYLFLKAGTGQGVGWNRVQKRNLEIKKYKCQNRTACVK